MAAPAAWALLVLVIVVVYADPPPQSLQSLPWSLATGNVHLWHSWGAIQPVLQIEFVHGGVFWSPHGLLHGSSEAWTSGMRRTPATEKAPPEQ